MTIILATLHLCTVMFAVNGYSCIAMTTACANCNWRIELGGGNHVTAGAAPGCLLRGGGQIVSLLLRDHNGVGVLSWP